MLIVIPGPSMNRVYDECTKHFKCWRYTDDLDANIPTNDRTAKDGPYAVWHRTRREADEELKNLSANDTAARGVKAITLLERMLLELKYWQETRNHLDIQNVTLCAGSRRAGGRVPDARWLGGLFSVNWRSPASRLPRLRVREVLS
ncbi:hypothetical protein BH11PAT2_BH11PAT2_07890 [soil metagenome]